MYWNIWQKDDSENEGKIKNKKDQLKTHRWSRKTEYQKKLWGRKLLKKHLRKFSISERIH